MLTIRDAEPADAPAIAAVHVRAWREGYRGLMPDELLAGLSESDRSDRWHAILSAAEPASITLVAERPGGPVLGFCSYSTAGRDADAQPGTGEIWALYVDPPEWRSGVGRALTDAAIERLVAAGCDAVTLWVLTGNARGRAFYESVGFRPDGAEAVHEPTGSPDIRLRRALR